ncbi:MAG: sigma-70 family RNA polymerase sigma factor [Candidatus Binatia bacterium]
MERASSLLPTTIPTSSESPDGSALLGQVAQGREDALVALHRRYVNMVYSLSLHILGDQMGTEEVTQDVFMKVWQHPRAYDPTKGRFSSWLLTVTRHTAIDRLRQKARRPLPAWNLHKKHQDKISKAKTHAEVHHDLGAALEQLPLDQRDVIELAYFGRMSQQDIAEYLDLPLGTIKTRMRLGMKKLRAMWQQSLLDHESKLTL